MYVTLHQKSHQILEEYGKLVPQTKQVQDFIDGIHCSHSMMAAALSLHVAINTGEYFPAVFGYLCSVLAANKIEISTRDISGARSGS